MDKAILFVDLDGTLVRYDSFWFSVRKLIKNNLFLTIGSFLQIFKGKAWVKECIARQWIPSASDLVINPEVILFIENEKRAGRTIILATAANYRIAERLFIEIPLFDGWIASDAKRNLIGKEKLRAIQILSDGNMFDYIGDSKADMPILIAARKGYLVSKHSTALTKFKKS